MLKLKSLWIQPSILFIQLSSHLIGIFIVSLCFFHNSSPLLFSLVEALLTSILAHLINQLFERPIPNLLFKGVEEHREVKFLLLLPFLVVLLAFQEVFKVALKLFIVRIFSERKFLNCLHVFPDFIINGGVWIINERTLLFNAYLMKCGVNIIATSWPIYLQKINLTIAN